MSEHREKSARESVPTWLLRAGEVSWRLLAVGLVVFFGFRALRTVSVVVLAVVVALFLAAVLWSPTRWLRTRGWPGALASMATLLGAAAVLVGIGFFIAPQFAANFETIGSDLESAWDSIEQWLISGPLALSQAEIDDYLKRVTEWLQSIGQDSLLGGATAVLEFLTGTFLALIVTFFLLKDGKRLLESLLRRLPQGKAEKVAAAASIGRRSLAQYMGGIALVGLFDATLIALALWIVGAPLVIPLALLVFLGAFIPLIGAFLSGLLAVAITFVNGGVTDGLIILAVVVAVQQFEGDVIMPLVFGQTLRLHPLVILLGVTAGGLAFGLFGAFIAVPLIAVAVAIQEAISDDPDNEYLSLARG